MKVTKKTPRKEITIQGFRLNAPAPFAEGHPLTEVEAGVLNQTLAENLRNNFGSQLKKSKEDAEAEGNVFDPNPEQLQEAFDAYVAEYEFGAKKGGGGVTVDPVERKARALAKDTIKRAIQHKGAKLKDVGTEKLNELTETYFQQNSEALMGQARKLIETEKEAR